MNAEPRAVAMTLPDAIGAYDRRLDDGDLLVGRLPVADRQPMIAPVFVAHERNLRDTWGHPATEGVRSDAS